MCTFIIIQLEHKCSFFSLSLSFEKLSNFSNIYNWLQEYTWFNKKPYKIFANQEPKRCYFCVYLYRDVWHTLCVYIFLGCETGVYQNGVFRLSIEIHTFVWYTINSESAKRTFGCILNDEYRKQKAMNDKINHQNVSIPFLPLLVTHTCVLNDGFNTSFSGKTYK